MGGSESAGSEWGDILSEYIVTDTELTGIANAIRTKGGTSAPLEFPGDFVDAIDDISTGTDTSDATATAGDILSGKTAYIATGKATGTIASKSSSDLTASGDTVSVPAGYYASAASKAVAAGSIDALNAAKGRVSNNSVTITASLTKTAGYIDGGPLNGSSVTVTAAELVSGTKTIDAAGTTDVTNYAEASVAAGSAATPATTITANPTISVNSSTGVITATASASQSVTPSVSAGWVSSGTAGTVTVSGSNTSNLTTQAAQTITPTTSDQTIAAGKYLTGAQTIKGDANLIAANIAKDVSIFGVTGTHEGGGGWDKIVDEDVTVNTTSTSQTTLKTYNVSSGRAKDVAYYAIVKDKAGIRSGYFFANASVIYDRSKANGYNDASILGPTAQYVVYSTDGTTYTGSVGNNAIYGVYAQGTSSSTIVLYSRYSSSYSKTINGTYNVKIYQFKLPVAPFD